MRMFGTLLLLVALSAALPAQEAPADQAAADKYFEAEQWQQAADAYARITKAQPKNAPAWFRLGASLHELKRYREALEAYQRADKEGFRAKGTLQMRITRAQSQLGNKDAALASLKELVDKGFMQPKMLETEADLEPIRGDARFAPLLEQAKRNAAPCEHQPEFAQFDFWVGEWDVDASGQPAGKSRIEKILGSCVVMENWTGKNGYTGKSFNVYNKNLKKWQQFWVDRVGGVVEFVGEYKDGQMRYTSEVVEADGTRRLRRLTFFNLGPGHVRQFGEQSTDGGKTWSVEYDLNYVARKSETAQGR